MQGTIPDDRITITVPSASVPDTYHRLTLFDDGLLTCSCKGYTYRHTCRHTRAEADRAVRWARRTCTQCGASGPLTAFTATTTYAGGRGYRTTHACRNTAACGVRRQVAA